MRIEHDVERELERRGQEAPTPCYSEHCVLPNGHEPAPHEAANGYRWGSVHPKREGEPS